MSESPESPRGAPEKGLLVIYTGEGKGKTTAALGMVFRALGRNHKVAVLQFIKGKWKTGERLFAQTLPQLQFATMGEGFTGGGQDLNIDRRTAQAAWEKAKEWIRSDGYFLVVLDEITYAIQYGFISLEEVVDALKNRPPGLTVVLTGRGAPESLVEMADLVTEMKKVKHPFDRGIPAKPGVDF